MNDLNLASWPIEGVIYRVTVESPDHQVFEFNSWSNHNPYAAALALYTSHPSDCARMDEQYIRRSESVSVMDRGYGRSDGAQSAEPSTEKD